MTGACKGCGTPLPDPHVPGPPRVWCSHRCRKAQYSRPCPECGALMHGGDGLGPDAPKLCRRCDRRRAAAANVAAAEPQRLRVVALWAAGYTSGEIADDLGWDPVSMKVHISQLRALGFPLAYRRPQMIPWGERVAAIRSRQRAAK